MNICLVDDDDVINTVHSAVIGGVNPNASVKIFRSGAQFIQAIKNGDLSAFIPDIVFLDIRMPELDGFGVLDALNELNPIELKDTVIHVLSSTLDERDLSRAREHNRVKSFIGKPLMFDQMRELLS
ncbi:MAG: response regulator [Bacteroidota bacterium]|jgi:CheY-like chemotaxis protein